MGLPPQRLTASQKKKKYGSIDKWAAMTIHAIENLIGTSELKYPGFDTKGLDILVEEPYNKKARMQENIDLIEKGYYNIDRIRKVQKPFGESETAKNMVFPVDIEHYDILTKTINILIGEDLMDDPNFIVVNKSEDATNRFNQGLNSLTNQFLVQKLMLEEQKMSKQTGTESMFNSSMIEDPNQATVKTTDGVALKSIPEIEQYAKLTFSDASEIIANAIINYIQAEEKIKFKRFNGLRNFICTAREIYCVDEVAKDLKIRNVNPLNFDCILSEGEFLVENAAYCREVRYLTHGEIIDEFSEYLSVDEIDKLSSAYTDNDSFDNFNFNYLFNGVNGIRVARFEWKSLKKVALVKRPDGETEFVPEDYVKQVGEELKEAWVTERWEGTRIKNNIYVKMKPLDNQYRSMDSYSETKGSYYGYYGDYSLVDILMKLQDLYNETWYQIKRTIARNKGKAFIFDISQLPSKHGMTVESFFHMLDVHGVAMIDSTQRNEEGNKGNFNQFSSIDRSLGDELRQLIGQLDFIKNEVDSLSNVSKQRQGEIKSSETVGGVERSVAQSSAGTEAIAFIHSFCGELLMQAVIDKAKSIYKKGTKRMYILGDYSRATLEVNNDDFQLADIGVFVTNKNRDKNKLESIRQVVTAAYQAGKITLENMVKILETNSAVELKSIAALITKKEEEMMAMQQQQEQAMQQSQQQSQLQLQQLTMQIEQQKLELEKYKADLQASTAIEVARLKAEAQVYALRADIDADQNNNGVLDFVEKEKVRLKDRELDIKEKEHQDEMKMREKELQVSKTKPQK